MIRVLVAEDSATARGLIVHILSSDPEIQVVGEARDGVEAVEMTQRLKPNLVTMDIHMPRMDGLEATKEIMINTPTPIIIVTGSTHAREVEESLETLRIGALDVLVKPPGMNSPLFAEAARNLIMTVKAMSQVKVVRLWRSSTPAVRPTPPPAPLPVAPIGPRPVGSPAKVTAPPGPKARIVAVATSTGGPAALQRLLSDLPREFPVPIVVVQHITPGFTVGLAVWLSTVCPFRVKVAEEGEALMPRTVYIAPDDKHLGVTSRMVVALSTAPPVGGFRPSGTFLFDSVGRAFGVSTAAVIMTGMGEDGVAGLRTVRQFGGKIIAQDEKTSVIFGMPGTAIAAGLVDIVLPLDLIAGRLVALI